MYHPTRGGVRGGRDQFSWDDVKVDKHRENYLGHSVKAPVGRWQKGKDLNWYARDKKSGKSESDALKEEIKRLQEEEEQAMREALGLAPKHSTRPQGNRLDKHELSELVKRSSTAEDLGGGHSEAAWVHGIGFARAPRPWEDPATMKPDEEKVEAAPEMVNEAVPTPSPKITEEDGSDRQKKRKHEEKSVKSTKDAMNGVSSTKGVMNIVTSAILVIQMTGRSAGKTRSGEDTVQIESEYLHICMKFYNDIIISRSVPVSLTLLALYLISTQ